MSQLRSILDQLGLVDPEALTVDELDVEITELVRGLEFLDVLLAKHVKELSDRNGHAQLGFPSPTAYLKYREVGCLVATPTRWSPGPTPL
jgi:hypothetical protein